MANTVTFTQRAPVRRAIRRFQEFVHLQASGGIVLFVCTIVALLWANSPWASTYTNWWQTNLTVSVGGIGLSKPLLLWINDGLMAIFFFVVGLEIKREILDGELSSPRQAALPIAAAVGGMVAPALLYGVINLGSAGFRGWGIPMATDIAFALGALALLGDRIPLTLKVLLTALAIVDDIGAVVVIALFYSSSIAWTSVSMALGVFLLLLLLNKAGLRSLVVYGLLGLVLWVAVLKSGVHATIAGVLLALAIPSQIKINLGEFMDQQRAIIQELEPASWNPRALLLNEEQQSAIQTLETVTTNVQSPLQRLEHALHPWVVFFIMPIFALANAGVPIEGDLGAAFAEPVTLGIIVGLVVGKPLGVTLFSWLAMRTGLASQPPGISLRSIHGVGWLAGIGFTMALFIAGLASDSPAFLTSAKLGILVASVLAGAVGFVLLRMIHRSPL